MTRICVHKLYSQMFLAVSSGDIPVLQSAATMTTEGTGLENIFPTAPASLQLGMVSSLPGMVCQAYQFVTKHCLKEQLLHHLCCHLQVLFSAICGFWISLSVFHGFSGSKQINLQKPSTNWHKKWHIAAPIDLQQLRFPNALGPQNEVLFGRFLHI